MAQINRTKTFKRAEAVFSECEDMVNILYFRDEPMEHYQDRLDYVFRDFYSRPKLLLLHSQLLHLELVEVLGLTGDITLYLDGLRND